MAQMTQQQIAAQRAKINALARAAIKAKAVLMTQQVFSATYANQAANPQINIVPRAVGLTLGFWLKISATITATGAGVINPSDFGPANIMSNISFTDLENNVRINTTGWHLAMTNTLTARRPYFAPLVKGTGIDSVINYGDNFTVDSAPQVAASGSQTWTKWLWVPLAYSLEDLRGAIYLNVVNATALLQLTINSAPLAAAPADNLAYVGTGAGAAAGATMTNISVTVYQHYLDQLPRVNGQPILPIVDMSTVYELKFTQYTGLVQNQDFPMDYGNFRDYIATIAVVNNGNGRAAQSDVSYFNLQSANFTNIWKMETGLICGRNRNHMQCDLPAGCYYFGSRAKPISTIQYGNMQLNLNMSNVPTPASAVVYLAFEDFALKNQVQSAGSINAG